MSETPIVETKVCETSGPKKLDCMEEHFNCHNGHFFRLESLKSVGPCDPAFRVHIHKDHLDMNPCRISFGLNTAKSLRHCLDVMIKHYEQE